jgi:anti-anti-sigma factor
VPPPDLQIGIEDRGPTTLVTVAGEVDLLSSVQLKRAFDALLERETPPSRIRADLREVAFMDTSGVALLLGTRTRAMERGSQLVVTAASPALQRLFEITGIAQFLADD